MIPISGFPVAVVDRACCTIRGIRALAVAIEGGGNKMDISDWRKRIDEIDEQLVGLVNERAKAAQQIGRLKQEQRLPIHEPQREKEVYEKMRRLNRGPLPDRDLLVVFERIIDAMRKLQRDQAAQPAKAAVPTSGTELEAETNE